MDERLNSGDVAAYIKGQRVEDRRWTDEFVQSAIKGDARAFRKALETICNREHMAPAIRAVSRLLSVPNAIKDAFLQAWLSQGDGIRQRAGSDRELIRAMRILLPPYNGPAMQLYRGDGARNRRRRTYGLSWSSEREVAEAHANSMWRTTIGGSVLLETVAPPEAIICAVIDHDNGYGESEYLVDRSHLPSVRVLARFSQLSPTELQSDPD